MVSEPSSKTAMRGAAMSVRAMSAENVPVTSCTTVTVSEASHASMIGSAASRSAPLTTKPPPR